MFVLGLVVLVLGLVVEFERGLVVLVLVLGLVVVFTLGLVVELLLVLVVVLGLTAVLALVVLVALLLPLNKEEFLNKVPLLPALYEIPRLV